MTELPSEDQFTTLTGLVSQYSPSGQEAGAVGWLLDRMQHLGFTQVGRDEAGNAVGRIGSGDRQILLLGHIDTVPGEIPVRIDSDTLYGRGAVDAKGPLAAFVDAAAGTGPVDGWEIVVIGAVDEERDSAGARYLVDRFRPDVLIVGEPTGWDRIVLGYKGSLRAALTARRPVSHSAGPEPTAADELLKAWQQVLNQSATLNAGKERVFDQLGLKVLGLDSGDDGFDSWAELTLGSRLPTWLSPEAWLAEIEAICRALDIDCRPTGFPIPAYRADKNTPLVSAFLQSIRAGGGQPRFVVKTGTADLNIVAPAWGCQALVYGPGDSSLDHTPEEHIPLEDYARAVSVLSRALEKLTA